MFLVLIIMTKYDISKHYEQLVDGLVKKGLFKSKKEFIDMAIGKSLTEYYGIQNIPTEKEKTHIEKDIPVVVECKVQQQGFGDRGYIRPSKDDEVLSVLPDIHEDFELIIDGNKYFSYITRANAINAAYDVIYSKRMGPKGKNYLTKWQMDHNIKIGQMVYLIARDIDKKIFELSPEKPEYEHQLIPCK